MSQPLDAAQRKSVEQTLEVLARLLECLQGLDLRTCFEAQREAAARELAAVRALLADGRIDTEYWNEGHFGNEWLVLAVLIRKRYRYEQHTGWRGALRAPFDFLGNLSLMWSGLVQGQPLRSWEWKEFAAYGAAYAMLTSLGWLLDKVCKEKPLCMHACHKHLAAIQEAAARQNPWSTYGA
jgi:hypothetical protein